MISPKLFDVTGNKSMRLSQALRHIGSLPLDERLMVTRTAGGGWRAISIEHLVRDICGIEGPDDMPLLYAHPIFLRNGLDETCAFWHLLPRESLPDSRVTNIVFLDSFLNKLRVVHGWSFGQLADLVEKIEAIA